MFCHSLAVAKNDCSEQFSACLKFSLDIKTST